jgi:thiol:disulfide interchange protein
MPTAPIAALSLVAGFAVADATGIRALGGVVLIAAAIWCAVQWRRAAGAGVATALLALYVVAFAASHALARVLGAWPSVLTVAAVVGAAAWVFADARGRRRSAPATAGAAAAR